MPSAITVDKNTSLGEALRRVCAAYPEREAIIFRNDRTTYRQLGDKVQALAAGLHRLGINEGDKVGLVLPDCPEFIYAFFALCRLGAVAVPLSPQLRSREVHHILSDSEAVAVISLDKVPGSDLAEMIAGLRPELPNLRHQVVKGDERPTGAYSLDELFDYQAALELPQDTVGHDDVAALIYTSGTTGLPKGSIHTHHTLIAPVVATLKLREAWMPRASVQSVVRIAKAVGRYRMRLLKAAGKQQTFLGVHSYHGMGGMQVILQALLTGDKLVIMDKFHPVEMLKLIEQEKVSIIITVPTILAIVMKVQDLDKYDLSSVLVCGTGSAPVPPKLAYEIKERIGCALAIGFGTTEVAGMVSATSLLDPDSAQAETVGKLLPGVEAKIVDEQRQEVPTGEVGEVAVRVDAVMKGYYKAPEATAAVLDADGWYYTGDLATMDDQGYMRIVGRKSDMIKRSGQCIFPKEIEDSLATHPQIADVAVLGVPGVLGSEQVWAYVVPQDGAELTAKAVVEYCRGRIAPYKTPEEVRIVSELPKAAATGKTQKHKLRDLAIEEHRRKREVRSEEVR